MLSGDAADVDFQLTVEARIDGRVLTAEGQPAGQVRIIARVEMGGGNRQLFTTRSNPAGEFTITGIAAGTMSLTAEDATLGVASLPPSALAAGDREQPVLRLAPGARLTGTVRLAEGTIVHDAYVIALQGAKGTMTQRVVRTRADGSFVVPALNPGPTQLIATLKAPPEEVREMPAVPGVVKVDVPSEQPLSLTVAR